MLDNIPAELRYLQQWVVSGENKNPLNPLTGQPASVTDRSTWGTFEQARQAGYKHIGFVLSPDDPYAIIDLDAPLTPDQAARHRSIATSIFSYTELSQSGNGVHIVIKGAVAHGVRRDKVELYSSERYMIFTGNVINAAPISDYQPTLDSMFTQMASTVVAELDDAPPVVGDDALYDMAARASNGDKFVGLWQGKMDTYPSQSEADFALLAILAFYSASNSQVKRTFRYSELGKRDKAQRNDDYLNRALGKIRGRQQASRVDLTALLAAPLPQEAEQMPLPLQDVPWSLPALPVAVSVPVPPPPVSVPCAIAIPPGLIGEMSEYIYSSAIRPVREVALTAAISLGAGILGRHFNISSTGLNLYTILLAKTGTGKEGAAGGIDALVSAIRSQVPVVDEFVGPGTFASGQALTRVLDRTPCFVSVLGEVGITLQQICDKNAGPHNVQLRKVLLDVFAKSGWNKWLRPSVYSDTEKNTGLVRAPNVTILGESTPVNFYGALDSGHISEGLVPRFLVIEYTGPRPPTNAQAFHPPSPALVAKLTTACQTVVTMRANDTCCPVQTDRFAGALLSAFNIEADERINNSGEDEALKELWNRAHIKALKLSALIAVGCGIQQPIITKEIATWAIDLVRSDIVNMVSKFSGGDVGSGDHAQMADIVKAVDKWPTLTVEQRQQYKVPVVMLDKPQLVPYSYLKRFLVQRAHFKNDRRGAVVAIRTALDDMVKSGSLAMLPPDQTKRELGLDSPVYYKGESW